MSWLDEVEDAPPEEILARLEEYNDKPAILKRVLRSFWCREVRMRSAELLAAINSDDAAKAIVSAGESGRVSQAHAASLLETMTCDAAVAAKIQILEGRLWASSGGRFSFLRKSLSKVDSPAAAFFRWKSEGFSKNIAQCLDRIPDSVISPWVSALSLGDAFGVLDSEKVREYLVGKRNLVSVYKKIDGAEGALYLLGRGAPVSKKRLDTVSDKKLRDFLGKLHVEYFRGHFSKNPDLLAELKSRNLSDALARFEKPPKEPRVTNPALFEELANTLDVREAMLRRIYGQWECFTENHYNSFELPKKSGGSRSINAPSSFLKMIQRKVKEHILDTHPLSENTHGFAKDRSIVTNAVVHVGRDMVINLDLEDFFPSVKEWRVQGLFRSLGFSSREARLLTIITTYDGELPQGAPTSPAIANLVCRKMDRRLSGLAERGSASYTRYADDMTFSGPSSIIGLLPAIRTIIEEEGFVIADEKLRIQRKGRRQIVTGLTVNEKASVPRPIRRRLRAAVHHMKQDGYAEWDGTPLTKRSLAGHIAYVNSVDPNHAALLKKIPVAGKKRKK